MEVSRKGVGTESEGGGGKGFSQEFGSLRGKMRRGILGVGTACAETQGRMYKEFSEWSGGVGGIESGPSEGRQDLVMKGLAYLAGVAVPCGW